MSAKTCVFEECVNALLARGFCRGHYEQQRSGREMLPLRRRRTQAQALGRDGLGRKECAECRRWLPEGQFYRAPGNVDQLTTGCRRCRSLAKRAKAYGVSADTLEALLVEQDHCCAVCHRDITEQFHVDHDHACCPVGAACGACVRALLCHYCNTLLGLSGDSPAVLRAAAAYLEVQR